jgi:twinkle protein
VERDDSNFLRHDPCEACGSSDGKAVYSDGHTYCFVCEKHTKGNMDEDTNVEVSKKTSGGLVSGVPRALEKRKLSTETCKLWDYTVGKYNGESVQIANYKNQHGETVAQKIRFPNKDFVFLGNTKDAGLYGMHLWRDGGKMVTVVEGEIDALSLSQAQGNKWAVVSVPNGAQGAKKSIQKNLEWLNKFETVVFMFDNDEHGIKAAKECASILPPNKAKIASLPLKDANEMLVAGRTQEMITAMWNARTFRPDGIVSMGDLWDKISTPKIVQQFQYPFQGLNEKTMGIRKGEIVTVTAGSGIGKSQICREIAYNLIQQGQKIGYIALEESVERTSLGLMSIAANKLLHLAQDDITQYKEIFERLSPSVELYDHWGSTDSDNLMNRIRYLVRGCDCDFIVLDHLSIVVSGIDEGDERRLIDNTMTKLRALVEELKCGMVLVSHLKRPQNGKGHEDGAQTSLAQLRGSAAIGQLSDIVIGAERDQQSKTPDQTTLRILKNRWTGETGIACQLKYDRETGRMSETEGFSITDEDQEY